MIYSSALPGTSVPTEDQSFKGFLQSVSPSQPPLPRWGCKPMDGVACPGVTPETPIA